MAPAEPQREEVPAELVAPVAVARTRLGWFPLLAVASAGLHLLVTDLTTGLRWEHWVTDLALAIVPWLGPRVLSLIKAAYPLWLTGVMVDSQRFLKIGTVHTGDFYRWELAVFPAHLDGRLVTWAERLSAHPVAALDLLCGFAYIVFFAELFAIGGYLYWLGRRDRFLRIAWAFFIANALGLLIYAFFPVAPPWYVVAHGLGPADLHALPSAAGAARFDALLHIHYFADFYARNPNVFGSMPSLHVSYPAIALWYTWERGWGWRLLGAAFLFLMCFSAIYLVHHYVLDLVAGVAVGLVACALSNTFVRWFSRERAPQRPILMFDAGRVC